MIADLKPYPEYKESGQEWLGVLPVHWNHFRAKCLYREVDERSKTGNEELLSVSHLTGVTPRSQKRITMFLAKSNVGYKICRPGDTVINTLWAWMGALGVARHVGIVSPAYGVYRPLAGCGVLPRYADHLLRTPAYAAEYERRSTGVNSARLRLYPEHFLRIPVVVPTLEEQAAIVRFLDWANGRLERTIRAKRRVIALLTEQKQVIIHRAVTRGLDLSVSLKPSGITWLGDIPKHWEVRRLRHLIKGRLTYGANAAAAFTNLDWPRYIRITDFRTDGSLRGDTFRSLPPSIAFDFLVEPGDILLARSGATVGKAFLVVEKTGVACHAGYLIRARPDRGLVSPEFLFAFTQSRAFVAWKDSTFNTATIQNIGADKYADLAVPFPSLAEQHAILDSLARDQAPLDTAISRLEREIELLREYRTRLVADVVTGKLDVREAASRLPEEDAQYINGDVAELNDGVEPFDEEPAV